MNSRSAENDTEFHDHWVMGDAAAGVVVQAKMSSHHNSRHEHRSESSGDSRTSSRKHRSSRSRSKRRRTRNSLVAQHKWALVNGGIFVLFILVIIGVILDQHYKREDMEVALSQTEAVVDGSRGDTVVLDSGISLSVLSFENDPVLVNGVITSFLTGAEERFESYRSEGEPADVGMPVTIRFGALLPKGVKLLSSAIAVSENENMKDSRTFSLDANTVSASVYGLKTNTTYYYEVTLSLSNNTKTFVGGMFHTADTPRILSIAGLRNVRDIGNWKTTDGGAIRQGLLIRGSAAQGSEYAVQDRAEALSLLDITTEMDLRSHAEASGIEVFGGGVAHLYFDSPAYMDAFTEAGMEKMRVVVSTLADEQNYPIYLHCTDGTDRTATVCLLLEALLGMSREDILTEHALTDPYNAETLNETAEEFLAGLDAYSGSSLRAKTESYLTACGVTADELSAIRDILLG